MKLYPEIIERFVVTIYSSHLYCIYSSAIGFYTYHWLSHHYFRTTSAGIDWQNALRDLQTVGQSSDFMRDFEVMLKFYKCKLFVSGKMAQAIECPSCSPCGCPCNPKLRQPEDGEIDHLFLSHPRYSSPIMLVPSKGCGQHHFKVFGIT